MKKKQQKSETQALARAIRETDEEIRRLEAQIASMRAVMQRRGLELAKRVQKA